MSTYTTLLESPFDQISPEDDSFIEELLEVAQLFRPFSEGLDDFIAAHGYEGDMTDAAAKVGFIRGVFRRAGMSPPREIGKWYSQNQPIRRDTAFQICFAFGLDGVQTDEFFRRVFVRERSFDCHRVQEAVYYYCLNNGLDYASAQDILSQLPEPPRGLQPGQSVVFTNSIVESLNRIDSRATLVRYLSDNIALFSHNNATAYDYIRRLWGQVSGENGLVAREFRRFYSGGEDAATDTRRKSLRKGTAGAPVSTMELYLGIFQLDKKRVYALHSDRTLKPLLECLRAEVKDSFPDRQGIEGVLAGRTLSYERVRKLLILLAFYVFWAKRRLERGSYEAGAHDGARCVDEINRILFDAGYPELYVGNPYDWLFLYAARQFDPLATFREIWQSLLDRAAADTGKPSPGDDVIQSLHDTE